MSARTAEPKVVPVPGKPWQFTLPDLPCPFCGQPGVLQNSNYHGYRPGQEWSIGCPTAFIPHGAKGYYDCGIHPCTTLNPSKESALTAWAVRAQRRRQSGSRKP